MLRVRNQLAHDYDGSLAAETFTLIITTFYDCFEKFRDHVSAYYADDGSDFVQPDSFRNNNFLS